MTIKLQVVIPEDPPYYWEDVRENLKLKGTVQPNETYRVLIEDALKTILERCIGPVPIETLKP